MKIVIPDKQITLTFQNVLVFTTGADSIPPGGFVDDLKLDFYTQQSKKHFPTASTCDMRMCIPRGVGVVVLQALMEEVTINAPGFAKI